MSSSQASTASRFYTDVDSEASVSPLENLDHSPIAFDFGFGGCDTVDDADDDCSVGVTVSSSDDLRSISDSVSSEPIIYGSSVSSSDSQRSGPTGSTINVSSINIEPKYLSLLAWFCDSYLKMEDRKKKLERSPRKWPSIVGPATVIFPGYPSLQSDGHSSYLSEPSTPSG
ncbi:MAG: hypothetical protein EBX40_04505 [Gammaproteobacteria bacterium]|nr:hypothetical protein [Gammaproteobacteria bacterium]